MSEAEFMAGQKWIDSIEEPIRPIVKLLRDAGFNTVCSCGHEMYVQCHYIPDGEIYRLFSTLYDAGYRDFELVVSANVIDGYPSWGIEVRFREPKWGARRDDDLR